MADTSRNIGWRNFQHVCLRCQNYWGEEGGGGGARFKRLKYEFKLSKYEFKLSKYEFMLSKYEFKRSKYEFKLSEYEFKLSKQWRTLREILGRGRGRRRNFQHVCLQCPFIRYANLSNIMLGISNSLFDILL